MTWVLKSLKHLLLKLLTKVHNVWAKKVLRSYISWYWGVVQNWKKNWLVVCKMTYEDFGKLSPEHLIVSKLGFWWNPFIQIRKYMSLKFTEELCVMTMKNDAKFERKLTCLSNWREEFDEFWPGHSNISKSSTLMASFRPKYIIFELNRYRGVIFDGTEDWSKIWRKTDLCFQNRHEEFGKCS